MKKKKLFLLTLILFCLSLSSLISTVCCAQEAGVLITSVNTKLMKTITVGNNSIRYYNITVILHNSGSTKSDELSVKFYDPQFNATTAPLILKSLNSSNYSIPPGENKIFYSDWPTPLSGDVILNITFSPKSPGVQTNKYNSGYYLYTLHIGSPQTKKSTPGFELAVLLVAIIILFGWRKSKK
jgi:hypothetical protein